ncbi:hypothetical protein K466DRAFT_209095 [Polyporus arcularius HHB13444]|uniref:Uncharacterized protein n=1 Tax=Polyporus arcularius HHB13444 TaxID=1314778 RepID=A0A5C3P9G2_9APHY|nr:hypothetical protein K466DRAFT_209095 [Polyporus arcularius HHB13444]
MIQISLDPTKSLAEQSQGRWTCDSCSEDVPTCVCPFPTAQVHRGDVHTETNATREPATDAETAEECVQAQVQAEKNAAEKPSTSTDAETAKESTHSLIQTSIERLELQIQKLQVSLAQSLPLSATSPPNQEESKQAQARTQAAGLATEGGRCGGCHAYTAGVGAGIGGSNGALPRSESIREVVNQPSQSPALGALPGNSPVCAGETPSKHATTKASTHPATDRDTGGDSRSTTAPSTTTKGAREPQPGAATATATGDDVPEITHLKNLEYLQPISESLKEIAGTLKEISVKLPGSADKNTAGAPRGYNGNPALRYA